MKASWLSKLLKRLRPEPQVGASMHGDGAMDPETLKGMVRGIVSTRPDEIGCDECFEQVDRFAEIVLEGKDASEALPLVEDHLKRCGDCREEFEALMTALRALT